MLDCRIRGATVVDGTGAPGRRADVGIRDGRIASVGESDEPAHHTIDAAGLVLAPGFIDVHTHYDAQLFWDPTASPSSQHGVTTVVGGNCGFTLAPLGRGHEDYLRRMMARVEGMPLPALEKGLAWDWTTFGDWLGRLEGRVAVNAGFLVGHSAIRRLVMGEDAVGSAASEAQIAEMVGHVHRSCEEGALGFSTSLAHTHLDGAGKPVPSKWATHDEVLALCGAVRDHPGTTLGFITEGCLGRFSDAEVGLMTSMSLRANRPLNWNVLSPQGDDRSRYDHQLGASDRAAERGARVLALIMPNVSRLRLSFLTHCVLNLLPGWGPILELPVPQRIERLRDPATRRMLDERAHSKEAGILAGVARWERLEIAETFAPQNRGLSGRLLGDVAKERGREPFELLLDLVIADELRTGLWPLPIGDDDATWKLRAEGWVDPRTLVGGSDAGAHLDRMCEAPFATRLLGIGVRERQLISLEEAVRQITDVPARTLGMRERGRVAAGWHADLVLFDPETVGARPIVTVADLPGSSERLYAESTGIHRVLCNGREIVVDGEATGEVPGQLLRSGRDTDTVTVPGGGKG